MRVRVYKYSIDSQETHREKGLTIGLEPGIMLVQSID